MKKTIFILLLFILSCKKESCKTCTWTAVVQGYGHGAFYYTAKKEVICDEQDVNKFNGHTIPVYDGSGKLVSGTCKCE